MNPRHLSRFTLGCLGTVGARSPLRFARSISTAETNFAFGSSIDSTSESHLIAEIVSPTVLSLLLSLFTAPLHRLVQQLDIFFGHCLHTSPSPYFSRKFSSGFWTDSIRSLLVTSSFILPPFQNKWFKFMSLVSGRKEYQCSVFSYNYQSSAAAPPNDKRIRPGAARSSSLSR